MAFAQPLQQQPGAHELPAFDGAPQQQWNDHLGTEGL